MIEGILPKAAVPNGLHSVQEYKLGNCVVSRMSIFVITHILYSTTEQRAHSFQNTVTQTAVEAGRSAGDVDQGVRFATGAQRREAHSHSHICPDTGGFCLQVS